MSEQPQITAGWCPVFRPSWEQFGNFCEFLKSIDSVGYEYGLVKVIPPPGWSPRHAGCHQHSKVLNFSEANSKESIHPFDIGPECIGKQIRARTVNPPGSWLSGTIHEIDPSAERCQVKFDDFDELQWLSCSSTQVECISEATSESPVSVTTPPTIEDYQSKLDKYQQHFSDPRSALVWLAVVFIQKDRVITVPNQFRDSSDLVDYAVVFRALGLKIIGKKSHDWTFDEETTDFGALQTALKRKCRESKVDMKLAFKECADKKPKVKDVKKKPLSAEVRSLQEDIETVTLSVPDCHMGDHPKIDWNGDYELGLVGGTKDRVGDILIQAPIRQHCFGTGVAGVHSILNVVHKEFLTVDEFREEAAEAEKKEQGMSRRAASSLGLIAESVDVNFDAIEREFWKNINHFHPIYGADSPGTIFHDENSWNMNDLKTILDILGPYIPGVTTPYLYFGQWRSMFSWHVEDQNLYSINYLHFGPPKVWYGIPPSNYINMVTVCSGFFPTDNKACRNFLRHKMSIISPKVLVKNNITFRRGIQHANEFMITWPTAFHAGFNCGFNCAEAVNFALPSWIPFGRKAVACKCQPDHQSVDINMDIYDEDSPNGLHENYKVILRKMFPFVKKHVSLKGEPPMGEEEVEEEEGKREQLREQVKQELKQRHQEELEDGDDDSVDDESDYVYDEDSEMLSSSSSYSSASDEPILGRKIDRLRKKRKSKRRNSLSASTRRHKSKSGKRRSGIPSKTDYQKRRQDEEDEEEPKDAFELTETAFDGTVTHVCACGLKTPNYLRLQRHKRGCQDWADYLQSGCLSPPTSPKDKKKRQLSSTNASKPISKRKTKKPRIKKERKSEKSVPSSSSSLRPSPSSSSSSSSSSSIKIFHIPKRGVASGIPPPPPPPPPLPRHQNKQVSSRRHSGTKRTTTTTTKTQQKRKTTPRRRTPKRGTPKRKAQVGGTTPKKRKRDFKVGEACIVTEGQFSRRGQISDMKRVGAGVEYSVKHVDKATNRTSVKWVKARFIKAMPN